MRQLFKQLPHIDFTVLTCNSTSQNSQFEFWYCPCEKNWPVHFDGLSFWIPTSVSSLCDSCSRVVAANMFNLQNDLLTFQKALEHTTSMNPIEMFTSIYRIVLPTCQVREVLAFLLIPGELTSLLTQWSIYPSVSRWRHTVGSSFTSGSAVPPKEITDSQLLEPLFRCWVNKTHLLPLFSRLPFI